MTSGRLGAISPQKTVKPQRCCATWGYWNTAKVTEGCFLYALVRPWNISVQLKLAPLFFRGLSVFNACVHFWWKYSSETTVGFGCHCHLFLPSAILQILPSPSNALWMLLLVERENVNRKSEKPPVAGVGAEKVSGDSRERLSLLFSQRVSFFRIKTRACDKQAQIERKNIPLLSVLQFLVRSDLYCTGSIDSY